MSFQPSMVGLIVADMRAALEFYLRLGLDIPEGAEEEPFVEVQMDSGVNIFWDTFFAKRHYPDMEPPKGGSRVMLEFFLEDEAAVDAKSRSWSGSGTPGRWHPSRRSGPTRRWLRTPTATSCSSPPAEASPALNPPSSAP